MTPNGILKVSVLASNDVLLNGKRVTLAELAPAMKRCAKQKGAVWYYQEDPFANVVPRAAKHIAKLIRENKLRVRISMKPDFSDEVKIIRLPLDLEQLLQGLRQMSALQAKLIIARKDDESLHLEARHMAPPSAQTEAFLNLLLPPNRLQNVVVIADTSWSNTMTPDDRVVDNALPFFNLLEGMVQRGHAVCVFDPENHEEFQAACRDADLAIIEGRRMPELPESWRSSAIEVMRTPRFLLYDRTKNHFDEV